MTLEEIIEADWREAMKHGTRLRKDILTLIRAELHNYKISGDAYETALDVGDDVIRAVLRRMVADRKDVISMISGKGRSPIVIRNALEIMAIEKYLKI